MASRFSSFLLRRLISTPTAAAAVSIPRSHPAIPSFVGSNRYLIRTNPQFYPFTLRFLSTRPRRPDIGARARQLQTRRLWTYALTFSCIAGFIVIVLNQFQDQLVFFVTPTEGMDKYKANPSKSKFRIGGLVLEDSVIESTTSSEIQFVVTDLMTDILIKFGGNLPDLFREGHSVIVEGSIKPFDERTRKEEEASLVNTSKGEITQKARNLGYYFAATEVLAKHDEKYVPKEVANAIEKNKKLIEEQKAKEALVNANASGESGALQA